MILGFGNDLCDIRRIERALERYGERFTHRLFTKTERAKSACCVDYANRTGAALERFLSD